MLGNFPQYNGCELFARRKKAYLAEDIYILGHCLVNKLEDRRLKNIVKGNQANESTNVIQDEVSPNSDLDILQTCTSLKSTMDLLVTQVKGLVLRVGTLEKDVTSMKIMVQHLTSTEVDVGLLTESSGDESDAESEPSDIDSSVLISSDRGSAVQNTGPTQQQREPSSNEIINSTVLSDQREVNGLTGNTNITVKSPITTSPHIGFCHTQAERRRIKKGGITKPPVQSSVSETSQQTAKSAPRTPVVGRSHQPHRIKAASSRNDDRQGRISESTHLVYVGHLIKGTSEDAVRAHLADVGLLNSEIADVMKLNCKNPEESSFCISLSTSTAENKVYNSGKWPQGVRIRPFTPQVVSNKSKNREHPPHNRLPQRLSQRPLHSRHHGHVDSYQRDDNSYNSYFRRRSGDRPTDIYFSQDNCQRAGDDFYYRDSDYGYWMHHHRR